MSDVFDRELRQALVERCDPDGLARDLAARFVAAGHEISLVGGKVRDGLLGRAPTNDYDLATSAPPDVTGRILAEWGDTVWDAGIAFGTVGTARRGKRFEVTTYRADRYDRVSRNPEVVYGESLADDLVRRDFSVNAMAVELVGDCTFHDPTGGLADLRDRVIRTPAAPEESFADDPLRLLRAARFASQLGFEVTAPTRAAMVEHAPELARIVPERVQAELTSLMLGAHPRRGIELMVDTGLADVVLPEIPALRMEADEHGRHKDVYAHTLQVLDQAIGYEDARGLGQDLVLRLAALLHDIGKPATRRVAPDGKVSFHHHEVVGAKMARRRLTSLRFPKDVVRDVSRLVELHLRFYGYRTGEWTDSAVRRYVTDADELLPRLHVLVRSDCTTRNRRRARSLAEAYDALERRIAEIQAAEDLRAVRPDLDGNEIMRLLGLAPGPTVGRAWRHLKELRLEHGSLTYEEAVAALRAWAAEEGLGPPPGP